jgi:hypothetical protein
MCIGTESEHDEERLDGVRFSRAELINRGATGWVTVSVSNGFQPTPTPDEI